jgi:hypothetical protein
VNLIGGKAALKVSTESSAPVRLVYASRMTSARRIEMKNVSWFGPYFEVDERIPAAVRDSISANEWKHFCSDVKACTQPMQVNLMLAHFGVLLSTCFLSVGLIWQIWDISVGFGSLLFSVSLKQFAIANILSHLYDVCEKHSRSDRTFHVRQMWGHIHMEISIAPTAQTALNPELAFVQNNPTQSAASRLQELDSMGQMITPQECAEKSLI